MWELVPLSGWIRGLRAGQITLKGKEDNGSSEKTTTTFYLWGEKSLASKSQQIQTAFPPPGCFFKGMACWHLGIWRVDHGLGRSFLLAETSHLSYTENVHCSEGLFVFPLLRCASWHWHGSHLPTGCELCGGRLTSSGHTWVAHLSGDLTLRTFLFLFLTTPHPISSAASVPWKRISLYCPL